MSSTRDRFVDRVEAFLMRSNMAPSRFGLLAVNDPNFVFDVRRGRKLSTDLMDRVDSFMAGRNGQTVKARPRAA